jgi:signal transduction histidine kinase
MITATSDMILFVEDNADLRDSAAHLLELNGFNVKVASDGQEALELLDNTDRPPDLIVSDISMPRMNGYDFFDAVRSQRHLQGVPFIFLTALGARSDIRLGREIGVDDYLVKPFHPEDFLAAVQSRLKRTRELQELAGHKLKETRHMLVKILSHELRTPLTYVTGGFTLLADEINKQEESSNRDRQEIGTILDLIKNGTTRLSRLAEQTVLLSELMSGQTRQEFERMCSQIEVAYLIQSAIAQVQGFAQENKVTIISDENLSRSLVYGAVDLLITAITEVLRNAIQYSERESNVWITTEVDDEDMIVIEVRDQGRGIPPSDIESIWELISQSERARYEQQGFGLGLPLTKQIIDLHKGDVNLESTTGEGTTISLRIPQADEIDEE